MEIVNDDWWHYYSVEYLLLLSIFGGFSEIADLTNYIGCVYSTGTRPVTANIPVREPTSQALQWQRVWKPAL